MHNEQWIFGHNFSVFGQIEKSLMVKLKTFKFKKTDLAEMS